MKLRSFAVLPILAAMVVSVLATTSCATKKYVQNTINPVQQKVGDLDKKTAENTTNIEELETSLSRTNERAMTADSKAADAAKAAAEANEQAAVANRGVGDAKQMAEQGINKAGEVERTLGTKIDNVDNYKLMSTENVLFGFNQSTLTKEAKEQLDGALGKVSPKRHYVIEVQGFTDKSGSVDYNLELSRRRAASVVRYLTVNHEIPLYRVHTLGYGEEEPVADNSTRAGRKQNRRVEVKFYQADMGSGAQMSSLSPNQ